MFHHIMEVTCYVWWRTVHILAGSTKLKKGLGVLRAWCMRTRGLSPGRMQAHNFTGPVIVENQVTEELSSVRVGVERIYTNIISES